MAFHGAGDVPVERAQASGRRLEVQHPKNCCDAQWLCGKNVRNPPFATSRWAIAALAFSRSEEHTSELQSLMRISYAVFCLKKKKHIHLEKQYTYVTKT